MTNGDPRKSALLIKSDDARESDVPMTNGALGKDVVPMTNYFWFWPGGAGWFWPG